MLFKLFSLNNNFLAEYYDNGSVRIMNNKEICLECSRVTAVKFLNDSILCGINNGYSDFNVIFKEERTFSNICAPIAGVLKHYQTTHNLKFNIIASNDSYINHTHITDPLIVQENVDKYIFQNPFDKVWFFDSDKEINDLINSYLFSIRQADIIAEGVINSIEWCLNETLDNILQHSDINSGYIMGQIHQSTKRLSFCVFDAGIGIYNSLKNSNIHNPSSPIDAIMLAMQEKVTRDSNIGQGNGLWGLSNLISQTNGILRISSGGATYINNNGNVSIVKQGNFNLGRKLGTTTIDFQLDYSKNMDISAALPNYKYVPVDLWLENLETNDENVVQINILKMSNGTGTRKSAEKLRTMILNIVFDNKKKIILDFDGINTISSSFADELIGKIIKKYGFVFFTQIFKLINLKTVIINIINRSVEQRMAQTYYDNNITMDD